MTMKMIPCVLLSKCNSSIEQSKQLYFRTQDFISSSTPNFYIIITPIVVAVAFYVYYKCPYIVRMSGTLCIVTWLIQLLPAMEQDPKACCRNAFVIEQFRFQNFYVCFVVSLQRYYVVIHSVFFTLLFIRLWWCEKINLIRDLKSVGFNHLEHIANARGKTMSDMIRENFRTREIGKIPPVFPNGWIPILESTDLKKGCTKPVFALGQSFATFRGQDGTAYVLDAFCPHLGANLAVGGRVVGNCLECPFHKWQFDAENGTCSAIPYTDKMPMVGKIKSWTSKEVNGFIYVWHHAENLLPSWDIPVVAEVSDGLWSYRGRVEHIVHCHLQEIPENGADVAHLNQLHSESVFSGTNGAYILRFFTKHEWTAHWKPHSEEGRTHIAKLSLIHVIRLFNIAVPWTKVFINVQQIGPSVVHLRLDSTFGKGIFIQNIVTEQPLQQRIIHHLYTELKVPQWLANQLLKLEAIMLERDIAVWNNKKYLKNPVLIKEDKAINSYRRWYSQFYSENSPTLKDIREKNLSW